MTTLHSIHSPHHSCKHFETLVLAHVQGCRAYLLADPESRHALALDVHLDLVQEAMDALEQQGWELRYVVDSHTHADHLSGSAQLARRSGALRVAHAASQHTGVKLHPTDGQQLHLGDLGVTVLHAPGHTPDHLVLRVEGAVFSGDTLLIGGVARTDFLGGDAGQLFDSLRRIFDDLPDETVVYPGHDYVGRQQSTMGDERRDNPWLRIPDRAAFVRELTANKPPQPANMDDLLRANREGIDIPASMSAVDAVARVRAGGAASVVDVRTGLEFEGEHVPGSRLLTLDQLAHHLDEVRATPAPRLLLCRSGARADKAKALLEREGVQGLTVVEGGIEAFRAAGGETERGRAVLSLERQVRIAAGLAILASVMLGYLWHPALFGVAGFVGGGLTLAGVTDWCGMGLLLAKAPWNRVSAPSAVAPAAACAASAPAACSAGVPAQE